MEEKSSNEKGILWSARYWSRSLKKSRRKNDFDNKKKQK